jgi:hypothetical protein
MKKFREFLLGFQKKYRLRADGIDVAEGEGEEYTYVEMLKTVRTIKWMGLMIDASNSSFVLEFIDSRFSCVSFVA